MPKQPLWGQSLGHIFLGPWVPRISSIYPQSSLKGQAQVTTSPIKVRKPLCLQNIHLKNISLRETLVNHLTRGSLPPTLHHEAKWTNDMGQLLLNLTPRASDCTGKTQKPGHSNLNKPCSFLKTRVKSIWSPSVTYLHIGLSGLFQILAYSLIAFPEWSPKALCKSDLQSGWPVCWSAHWRKDHVAKDCQTDRRDMLSPRQEVRS